jgi:hypothetical protein
MFVGVSVSESTNGVVKENKELLEVHRRLLKIASPHYRQHRMPCPCKLRKVLPLAQLKFILDFDRFMVDKFGISFSTPQFSAFLFLSDRLGSSRTDRSFSAASFDLIKATGLTETEFEEAATKDLQDHADAHFVETGEELDLATYPPVRPGSDFKKPIEEDFESKIRAVSSALELGEFASVFCQVLVAEADLPGDTQNSKTSIIFVW